MVGGGDTQVDFCAGVDLTAHLRNYCALWTFFCLKALRSCLISSSVSRINCPCFCRRGSSCETESGSEPAKSKINRHAPVSRLVIRSSRWLRELKGLTLVLPTCLLFRLSRTRRSQVSRGQNRSARHQGPRGLLVALSLLRELTYLNIKVCGRGHCREVSQG